MESLTGREQIKNNLLKGHLLDFFTISIFLIYKFNNLLILIFFLTFSVLENHPLLNKNVNLTSFSNLL